MANGPTLPPQAYTREILTAAFNWLQTQPESVRKLATTPDALVGLYMRAQRYGNSTLETDAPVSSQNFMSDLKSLAEGLKQFEMPQTAASVTTSKPFQPHQMAANQNYFSSQNSHHQHQVQNQPSQSHTQTLAASHEMMESSERVNSRAVDQITNQITNQITSQITNQITNQISNQISDRVASEVAQQIAQSVSHQLVQHRLSQAANERSNERLGQMTKAQAAQLTSQMQAKIPQQTPATLPNANTLRTMPTLTESQAAGLNETSLRMIHEVKNHLNLSSDAETINMMLALAYKNLKNLLG